VKQVVNLHPEGNPKSPADNAMLLKPFPDPFETAAREADRIRADPHFELEAPLERVLGDAPGMDREALIEGTLRLHRERMERVPDAVKFPESPPWVAFIRATDRHLREMTGIDEAALALRRSLGAFVAFRAREAVPTRFASEKCRAIFIPDSDHGAIIVKNLDDPSTYWKARPPLTGMPYGPIGFEGVGSGLHFDDEPGEIFPLAPCEMLFHYCDNVPGAVDFLRRYTPFWGRANLMLFDAQKRSASIEKCSFNFFEVFEPDPLGRSIVSGMTCRDPGSPQARHQAAMRHLAVQTSGRDPADSPDEEFWTVCDRLHSKLRDAVASWGPNVRLDEVIRLFTTPYPDGLNKQNVQLHPEQPVDMWTLATTLTLPDERRVLRWQRMEGTMEWPATPEEYRF